MTDEVDFKGQYTEVLARLTDVCTAISALPVEDKLALMEEAKRLVAGLGTLYDKYTDLLK